MPKIPLEALPKNNLGSQIIEPIGGPCIDREKCLNDEHFTCGKCDQTFHNFTSLTVHTNRCMTV